MWETSDARNKVEQGYQVVNSSHFYTYIVPGAPYYGVNHRGIYENWHTGIFSGKAEGQLDPLQAGLMGGKLHIWNDYGPTGYTWNEIARLSLPAVAAFGEKFWNAQPRELASDPFFALAEKLQNQVPLVELTTRAACRSGDWHWELEKETLFIANSQLPLELPGLDNLEYPWTATFEVTRHNDIAGNEMLMSSSLAAIYLDYQEDPSKMSEKRRKAGEKPKRGFACVRANQAPGPDPDQSYNPDRLIFDYQVPVGRQVELKLVGTRRQVELYADGEWVGSFKQQMLCPLTRFGGPRPSLGMHATLHRVKLESKAPVTSKLGTWNPESVEKGELNLPIERLEAGKSSLRFVYQSGAHGVAIESVELLRLDDSGQVRELLSRDAHDGFAGGRSRNTVYQVDLPSAAAGSKLGLRVRFNGAGGNDSHGALLLTR